MKQNGSILVSFGKGRVAVHWEGRPALDIINLLFKNREKLKSCRTDASFTLKTDNNKKFQCLRNNTYIFYGNAGKSAVKLLDAVIYELAKKCSGDLLFHAAALSRNEFGILLPGHSGSGKTFLSACLARQGFEYLTDEMTLIESKTQEMKGFLKPLHIKDCAIPGLDSIIDQPGQGAVNSSSNRIPVNQGFIIDSFCFNPAARTTKSIAGLIVFPEFRSRGKFKMNRMSPAKTGLLLMKSLINARNFPSHGFDQITFLARNVPAYTVTYNDATLVIDKIVSLIKK